MNTPPLFCQVLNLREDKGLGLVLTLEPDTGLCASRRRHMSLCHAYVCLFCTTIFMYVDIVIKVPSAHKAHACSYVGLWGGAWPGSCFLPGPVLSFMAPFPTPAAPPSPGSWLLGHLAWNILLPSFHLIYSYLSFTSLLTRYFSEEEASLEVPSTSQARSGGGVFSLMTGAFPHFQIHSLHLSPASSLPKGSQRQACSLRPPRLQPEPPARRNSMRRLLQEGPASPVPGPSQPPLHRDSLTGWWTHCSNSWGGSRSSAPRRRGG